MSTDLDQPMQGKGVLTASSFTYGKNVFQAVRRYYRGLDNKDNWTWKCTKVVAVYDCVDTQTGQAGNLVCGKKA